jgi:hypothetical protein
MCYSGTVRDFRCGEIIGEIVMAHQKASEGSGIVWCHDSGDACITVDKAKFFAKVDQGSRVHDADLVELSSKLNALVNETEIREKKKPGRDSKLQIGFLVTGAGFLPVWKRQVLASERLEELVDIKSLVDLEAMTNDQLNAHLGLKAKDGGEWRRHYVTKSADDGVIHCSGAGKSCFVTASQKPSAGSALMSNFFPTVDQKSPVFDAALGDLANKLNTLVNETQARGGKPGKDPRIQIGFVITGSGLLPVWKIVDTDGPGDYANLIELDAMTSEQRDKFLRVSS